MTEVRKHQRLTASGKTTTVRHHTRDTGAQAQSAWADCEAAGTASAAPRVGSDELAALSQSPAQWDDWADEEWVYCSCAGSHEPGCPNDKPGGFPPLPAAGDDEPEV